MDRVIRRSLLAFALFAGACGPMSNAEPVEVCTQTGQRCRLSTGIIGVCTATEAAECATPPCLRCFGQH